MSNRTLVELNHDYCPDREQELEWLERMNAFYRGGNPEDLPRGVSFIEARHSHDQYSEKVTEKLNTL